MIPRPVNALRALAASILLAGAGAAHPAQEQSSLSDQGAQDVTANGFAFVELRTERSTFYVSEPIHVVLRFGFEEEFFRTNMIALFRPQMDVPVQVEAAWFDALSGATLLGDDDGTLVGNKTFVLNGALVRARAVDDARVDGRSFRSFEFERTWMANGAGELSLPETLLRFAYATRFGERALLDNTAEDRADAFVRGATRTLTIVPLPEDGRPASFSGAVGRLRLRTELSARVVEVNSSVKLALHIEGDGNLEFFGTPRIEPGGNWRMLGSIENKGRTLRTIEYDLAPTSEQVTRVPQLAFTYFDTTPPASYRTLESEALSIAVRAPSKPASEQLPAENESPQGSLLRTWHVVTLIVVLLATGIFRRHRSARRARNLSGAGRE